MDDSALRKSCADLVNKDATFANDLITYANKDTAYQHIHAAETVATNQKHVIAAYAAMWIAAVVFLVFLWRRQQGLKAQIDRLSHDLEAATKDDPTSASPAAPSKDKKK
jgi:hypothetical protein